jgi:Prokaryotic E2 family E
MSKHEKVAILVNDVKVEFERPEQTGRSIKARAHLHIDHKLCVDDDDPQASGDRYHDGELSFVGDDEAVHLKEKQRFWSIAPAGQSVTVTINGKPYDFPNPRQTGKSIKERAGIPLCDVLFRDRPGEDEVIPDDAKVVLRVGDCFHSSPPANYGGGTLITAGDVGYDKYEALKQPDGWTFLVVPEYKLPDGFLPRIARLLIKLPPLFPDAAPDMFWISPDVKTELGAVPQGTSNEDLLGTRWQRFSWHLQPGAWRAGASTLRDYMRCVRARFEKRN